MFRVAFYKPGSFVWCKYTLIPLDETRLVPVTTLKRALCLKEVQEYFPTANFSLEIQNKLIQVPLNCTEMHVTGKLIDPDDFDALNELYFSQDAILDDYFSDIKNGTRLVTFNNATPLDIVLVTGTNPCHKIWDIQVLSKEVTTTAISAKLKSLQHLVKRTTKSNTRPFIDAVIFGILTQQEFIYAYELAIDLPYAQANGMRGLRGIVEYSIEQTGRVQVIVHKASPDYALASYWSLVAQLSCIHRRQNSTIHGVLTDGNEWTFLMVDHQNQVWKSKSYHLFNSEELDASELQCVASVLVICLRYIEHPDR